jgi:hypothetical protein
MRSATQLSPKAICTVLSASFPTALKNLAANVAAPDPILSLAEFSCVVPIGLEPVKNATFLFASVS